MNKYKQLYISSQLAIQGLINNNNALRREINYIRTQGSHYETMLIANDMAMSANRYIWKNLPINLTSQQLESLFYQYGALCFYGENNKLKISRFITTGDINPQTGRLSKIKPVDFAGKVHDEFIDVISDDCTNGAVIIYDYTSFTSNPDEVSRMNINKATTIQDEIQVYRQIKNVIRLAVKKALIACETEEQKNIIKKQAEDLLDPDEMVAVIAGNDKNNKLTNPVQIFNYNNQMDAQNYCQLIDYYNKVRRTFAGIPSPDTFEKKERKIAAETENINIHTYLKLYDGLMQRTYGLELIKKYVKAEGVDKIEVKANEILLPKTDEHNIPEEVPFETIQGIDYKQREGKNNE